MKFAIFIRLFCLTVILSMLIAAVPVAAQSRFAILVPEEGSIGSTITIGGEGFNESTESTDKYANIYFGKDDASTIHDIDDEVTRYAILKEGQWLDENGEFTATFKVPAVLDDGDDVEDVAVGTYYVYVTHYPYTRIRAVAEFTVTGGNIVLDVTEGPVATEMEITGTDFASNSSLTVTYDGTEIDIESGDGDTDSSGEFISSVLIPESTAGDHTVKVTVSGSEAEATFTVEPEIILSPTSGEVAATVSVSGTGFGRRSDVVIYFNSGGVKTLTTDIAGSFGATFDIPELDPGIYDVEAEDDDGNLDKAKFTVTVPPPPTPAPSPAPAPSPSPAPEPSKTAINVGATSGAIGSSLVISGAGFEEGTITVEYDGEKVFTTTADANGIFVAMFPAPASKAGDHTVTVSDGTNAEEFIFSIESQAPPVPTPLLPEMGIEIVSPLIFDWQDVVDDSLPVTYSLQVATNEDFSAASIVLEKGGLTGSTYAVTEVEEAKLVGREASYYWRIKAIDGAANESDWAGVGQFYVARPFSMPNWTIYTLLGLGGLVLFAIGYWLGRRTAYYY